MKRFFLLALTAGLLSPIAAKAESYKWLVKVSETDSEMEEYEKRLEEDERDFDVNNREVDFFKEDHLNDEFIEF